MMNQQWETRFRNWAKPPSLSEATKCDSAVQVIRNAIQAYSGLNNYNVDVFVQGSYHNRTNVRQDSDVDVCITCHNSIFFDLPEGMTPADFNIPVPASYPYDKFRDDVGHALVSYLGFGAVNRGNKAFDIHENTYHVAADAVACFEYRRYSRDHSYLEGTSFLSDAGRQYINWPAQNYINGVDKNDATGRRYKAAVRILKNLNNYMSGNGNSNLIPSYLIECLVWNVPNDQFGFDDYIDDIRNIIVYLFNNTQSYDSCKNWGEVNDLKYLFRTAQPWTYQQANDFLYKAWNYIGFQ